MKHHDGHHGHHHKGHHHKDGHHHKTHPHHKGPGMSYFHSEHFEKRPGDVQEAGGRYASEMNTAEEYKHQNDALAHYVEKHRMKY